MLDQVAEGDRVATRWPAKMRPADAAPSTQEASDEVSMSGITIERFADGKVVESWRSMDRLRLLRSLGVLPRSTGTQSAATCTSVGRR